MNNIDFKFSHLPGKTNVLVDLLSRWQITQNPVEKLEKIILDYTSIPTHLTLTHLNYSIQYTLLCIFSDLLGSAAQLATSALARILQGFRPTTLRWYTRMWTDFLL